MDIIQASALALSMLSIGVSIATLRRLGRISRQTKLMIHETDQMIGRADLMGALSRSQPIPHEGRRPGIRSH